MLLIWKVSWLMNTYFDVYFVYCRVPILIGERIKVWKLICVWLRRGRSSGNAYFCSWGFVEQEKHINCFLNLLRSLTFGVPNQWGWTGWMFEYLLLKLCSQSCGGWVGGPLIGYWALVASPRVSPNCQCIPMWEIQNTKLPWHHNI